MSSQTRPQSFPAAPLHWCAALITAVALALFTVPAEAGRDGYRGGHYAGGWHTGSWRHGSHRGHSPRYYRHDHRHARHHRHDNRNAEYLLGGLVVGALVSHAFHSAYVPERRVSYLTSAPAPTVVTRTWSTTRIIDSSVPVTRSLYRDLDGNCFERRSDAAGSDLLIELPAAECAW